MSKFSKLIFILLGALAGILVLVLLGVNLYLQSEVVQERLRKATEASMGLPIEIRGASYTPWSGLTLSGISAADPGRPGRNLFEMRRLNVRLALMPLFGRRVVITSLAFVDPVYVVPESNPALPLPPTRGEVVVEDPAPGPQPPDHPPEEHGVAVGQTPAPGPSPPVPPSKPMRFTIEVQNLRIQNGTVVIRGAGDAAVGVLSGIEVHSRVPADLEASGEIRVAEAAFGGRFFIRDFRAPFLRESGEVFFPDYSATVGNGLWTGSFRVSEHSGAFTMNGKLDGVSAAQLLREAGMRSDRAQGELTGEFRVDGGGARQHPDGAASFYLTDAVLEPVDFLQQLGQALRIEELQLLRLGEARLDLTIGQGILHVDRLRLESENLILGATGPVDPGGEMDLEAKLLINRRLQQGLGGLLARNFRDSDEEGYKELAFRISGPIQRPRTDLLERATGVQIGEEVGRFLQNLFGAPRQQRKSGD